MTFPSADLPDPSAWFTGQLIDEAKARDNITDPLNLLPRGYIGRDSSSGTVTLSSTSNFAGLANVTFTLAEQRRVLIQVGATISPAGAASGNYHVKAAYNSGSSASVGSASAPGQDFRVGMEGAAANDKSGNASGDALLAAGTYTAYAIVQRSSGGAAGDVATLFTVLVVDIGAV